MVWWYVLQALLVAALHTAVMKMPHTCLECCRPQLFYVVACLLMCVQVANPRSCLLSMCTGLLNSLTVARTVSKQRRGSVRRTVSRVSSMASPQLGVRTARSSSDGGCTSPTKSSKDPAAPATLGAGKGRIIVLGWTEAAVPELLLQLQDTATKGSTITVVLPALASNGTQLQQASAGKQKQQAQQQPGLPQVQYLRVADPSSVQAFLEAGIADADAVMLGSALSADAAPASTEADALVTSAVLAIQQALQITQQAGSQAGKQAATGLGGSGGWQPRSKLHVVAVVSSYSVRRALQSFLSSVLLHCSFSYEIMLMDEFAAGMLVSVSGGMCWGLLVCHDVLVQRAVTVACTAGEVQVWCGLLLQSWKTSLVVECPFCWEHRPVPAVVLWPRDDCRTGHH